MAAACCCPHSTLDFKPSFSIHMIDNITDLISIPSRQVCSPAGDGPCSRGTPAALYCEMSPQRAQHDERSRTARREIVPKQN